MFAGLFIKVCLQKKAVAAIVSAGLIFRQLSKLRALNSKLIRLFKPLYINHIRIIKF
jgi:hypothetical protein